MKITAIKTFVMDAFRTNWTFVKVETDEGLYGWGEASLGTQEGALTGCVEDLKRLIVGRDPREIEKMCFEVYRDIYWKGGRCSCPRSAESRWRCGTSPENISTPRSTP